MTSRGDGERYGKPKVISSDQNETFRSLQKLLTTRGIQDQGLALIAGDKIIPEVAAHHRGRITSWITMEGGEAPPEGVPWIVLTKRLFDELNQFGTRSPLVTVTLPPILPWQDKSPWPKGCTPLPWWMAEIPCGRATTACSDRTARISSPGNGCACPGRISARSTFMARRPRSP